MNLLNLNLIKLLFEFLVKKRDLKLQKILTCNTNKLIYVSNILKIKIL